MRSTIKNLVPRRLRPAARKVYYLPADALDSLLGRRDPLVPPRGIANVGGGDFREIGERHLRYFVSLADLKRSERILDVGCGIGRMAVPLTDYLEEAGSYEGFDIVREEIQWCRQNITPRFPNFRFRVANICNKEYNPTGWYEASEYKFPYENASFDFVFLTSVFTHMLPAEVDNYLSEIARVIKPGGRCFATFFLLNEESMNLMESGASSIDFPHDLGEYRIKDKNTPENAVAYPERAIRDLHEKHHLHIEEPMHYGSWCGRKEFLDYQDTVISHKEN